MLLCHQVNLWKKSSCHNLVGTQFYRFWLSPVTTEMSIWPFLWFVYLLRWRLPCYTNATLDVKHIVAVRVLVSMVTSSDVFGKTFHWLSSVTASGFIVQHPWQFQTIHFNQLPPCFLKVHLVAALLLWKKQSVW